MVLLLERAKNVPNYAIVAGNPARIIKYRFSQEVIQLLDDLCWWDLPIDIIKENINLFKREDIKDVEKEILKMKK